ncbi:hypothetical protein V6N11_030979 [Hibiscus sabdariffa]|uniref:Uncharacterized protein n=1 Tax=Hibiscus sabdariffa TaxID=183260 RepID=A0ABR2NS66_9ROSI
MSAFRKAQAKGTRIGFLKWSAQSSERRSGHQVKAQKHRRKLSSRCNLSKVRRAGESNGVGRGDFSGLGIDLAALTSGKTLYPYQVNLLTLKTGYRLKRWTNASSSLCKKRSKVGVHIRQDPRLEPSVKELLAILPVEYLLARRKEACKEGLSVTSLSSERAKVKPSRIVGLDQEGSVEPVFIHFLLSQREGCHFKISLFLYRMLSFFDTLIGPSSSIG